MTVVTIDCYNIFSTLFVDLDICMFFDFTDADI